MQLKESLVIISGISFLLLLVFASPVPAQASDTLVIHEDPSNLTAWNNPPFDYKLNMLMQYMLLSTYDIAIDLNNSDYNSSVMHLNELLSTYEDYRVLLFYYNRSDPLVWERFLSSDVLIRSITMIVNDSYEYNQNYKLYSSYVAEGDMVNATIYGKKLQGSYQNLTRSNEAIVSNMPYLLNAHNDTQIFTHPLEQAIMLFDSYAKTVNDQEQTIDELLRTTNLTIELNKNQVAVGDTLILSSSLTDSAGNPLGNSKVSYYFDERRVGDALTDESGHCSLIYNVTGDSRNNQSVHAEYLPGSRNIVPGISSRVWFEVIEESTSMNMTAEFTDAAYGKSINVSGTLKTINGAPVSNRSINVSLGNNLTGSCYTDNDGYYSYLLIVGENTTSGISSLQSKFKPAAESKDVFLPSVSEPIPVEIHRENTLLTFSALNSRYYGGDIIETYGYLTTDGGLPVRNVSIGIFSDDRHLASCYTDEAGYYAASVPIPYNISQGSHDLYAAYSQENGSLYPSESDRITASFDSSTPEILLNSTPLILFAGDTLDLNGTVTILDQRPVPGQRLNVTRSDIPFGEVITDANGSFVFSQRIGYNESPGLFTVSLVTDDDGLITKTTTSAGTVLIIPADKGSIALLFVLVAGVSFILVLVATSIDRKILSFIQRRIKQFTEVEPVVLVENKDGVIADKFRPSVEVFNLDAEIAWLKESIASNDYREAVTRIYMASRQIFIARGNRLPSSATHREFHDLFIQKYSLLSKPISLIINKYESIRFARQNVDTKDLAESIDKLQEIYESLYSNKQNPGDREL
ncbi:hypothetical protein [Methanocella sp. MCL-LM]|uniref:hypothetical protein n=1 Tax=Methanocella sp. MCL-LM TaxID=3412035 RepID=UPI003C78013C